MLDFELVRLLQPQDLLHMDDADDIIELILVDGDAGVVAVRELMRQQGGLGGDIDRLDVASWRHDVVDADRFQVEQVGEHRTMLAAKIMSFEHQATHLLLRECFRHSGPGLEAKSLEQPLHEQIDEPNNWPRRF